LWQNDDSPHAQICQASAMEFAQYHDRLQRTAAEKNSEFADNGQLLHLINGGQLTPNSIDLLCDLADRIRLLSREKATAAALQTLLSHRRAMLYFTQPSTRTFLSFMAACQILGLTCNEVRDPKTSSEVKRESRMDAIRMFSSYFDVIIMRSPLSSFAEACSYLMNDLRREERRWVPIINAGSGSDEHPTQALLDIYTLKRSFRFQDREGSGQRFADLKTRHPHLTKGFAHKTYTFCGDIGRGRTVRSLATALSQYENTTMHFVAPDVAALRLDSQLRDQLAKRNVSVFEHETLDSDFQGQSVLSQTDCLYMTRIQREHNSADDENRLEEMDLSPFQLTPERASKLKEYTPILHPFPRDSQVQEIPEAIDLDPRAMYFRQARNGMWARAALLAHIFGVAEELEEIETHSHGRKTI